MRTTVASLCLAFAALGGAAPAHAQSATAGAVALAPHRAVYDLKLAQTRGKRPMQSVRGRILYDFSGSSCEGYALQFRQVSELDSGEGKTVVSDLRATTWEEGAGQRLRFHSQNFLDSRPRDTVDGEAQRSGDKIGVKLTKPAAKSLDIDGALVFPTEHVRRVLAAAREGKTILEIAVFDGSENGEKIYDTMTVIGRPIAPGTKAQDVSAAQEALAGLTRWPVTISYFEKGKGGGEQMPVYAITLEMYENGISRGLMLDYGDFVVSGEMTSLEIREAKPCR